MLYYYGFLLWGELSLEYYGLIIKGQQKIIWNKKSNEKKQGNHNFNPVSSG
jgi:hypothetical protein